MTGNGSDLALLEGARRAFERHGYHDATLERIAGEAGISRVTLHRRGMSKDGLLMELVALATEDYRQAMWPILVKGGVAATRMERALEALCAITETHMGLLVALRAQSDRIFHAPGDAAETSTRSVFTDPLERILKDGAADGSLRVGDSLEGATLLFNLVGWGYIHMRTGHNWPPDRTRDAVIRTVMHGLRAG